MSNQDSNKLVEKARLLLPWYLTNKLSEEEQALVNRALEASSELRQEFLQEEKMMRLVRGNTSLLDLSAVDTTEQRLDKMLARIEREEDQKASEASVTSPEKAEQRSHQAKPSKQQPRIPWYKKLFDHDWLVPANAVFASLLVVQLGVIGLYAVQNQSQTSYELASIEDKTKTTDRALFLIEFNPNAQHKEVCEFLNQWNARIVQGPNMANLFTIEMMVASNVDKVSVADKIMLEHQSKDSLVRFAGPQYQGTP